mgnify:CR=1 FL=1|jgi:hypothetical protein
MTLPVVSKTRNQFLIATDYILYLTAVIGLAYGILYGRIPSTFL